MTQILLTTDIQAPPEVCFSLCLDVDVQLSLDRGMLAVAGVTRGPLCVGDSVTWRARHFGILWRMTSKIMEVDPPNSFIDHMQNGPFAAWQHTHAFERNGTGTRMRDEVRYRPPFGLLGRIFDAAILEPYLVRLLSSRNSRLRVMAEGGIGMPAESSEGVGKSNRVE